MADPSAAPPMPPSPVQSISRSRCAPPGNDVDTFRRTQSSATLPPRHASSTQSSSIAPVQVPVPPISILPRDAPPKMNPILSDESALSDEADAASSGSGSRASPLSNSRLRFNPLSNLRQPAAIPNRRPHYQYQDHHQEPVPNTPPSSARLRGTSSFYNARRPPTSYRSSARRIHGNPSYPRPSAGIRNDDLPDDTAFFNGNDDGTGSVRSVLSRRATLDSSATRSSLENTPSQRIHATGPQQLDTGSLRRLQSAGTRLPGQSRSFYNSSTSNGSSNRLQVTSSFHSGVNPRKFSSSGSNAFTFAPRTDRDCPGGETGPYRRKLLARRGGAPTSMEPEVSFERALPPLLPRRSSLERIPGGARRSAASDIRSSAESVKAQLSSLFVGSGNSSSNRPPMHHQYPEHAFRRRASVCASSSGKNATSRRNLFGRGRRAGAPASNNTNTSFSMRSGDGDASMRSRDVELDLHSIADEQVVEYEYCPTSAATGVH